MDLSGECSSCKHVDHDAKKDHRCAYVMMGRQCPAVGVISKSVTGGNRFYCAAHFRALDNPSIAQSILDDYELHGLPDREDWRDKLIREYDEGQQSLLPTFQAEKANANG